MRKIRYGNYLLCLLLVYEVPLLSETPATAEIASKPIKRPFVFFHQHPVAVNTIFKIKNEKDIPACFTVDGRNHPVCTN
jgi:hypothetical protein